MDETTKKLFDGMPASVKKLAREAAKAVRNKQRAEFKAQHADRVTKKRQY